MLAAQETAARLVNSLGGGGLAAGFVRRYAEANRRRALLAHAARYRELVERISREALLAMAARVERDLQRLFGARSTHPARQGASRASVVRDALANQFRVEFYGRLAQLLDWDRVQLREFWRDLDLYASAERARGPRRARRGSRLRKRDQHHGAFADRCAFLLDSSLLARARHAASTLGRELERAARRAVNVAFQEGGADKIASGPRPRRRRKIRATRHRIGTKRKRQMRRRRKRGGRR